MKLYLKSRMINIKCFKVLSLTPSLKTQDVNCTYIRCPGSILNVSSHNLCPVSRGIVHRTS